MIVKRVEITLVGPDEWPEDDKKLEEWLSDERVTKYRFAYQLGETIRLIRSGLPEQFEVEVTNL